LLPDVKEGDGWRASGDEALRVSSEELVWLQKKVQKGVREVRQVEGKKGEPKSSSGALRW
jgi:hypothetical protein